MLPGGEGLDHVCLFVSGCTRVVGLVCLLSPLASPVMSRGKVEVKEITLFVSSATGFSYGMLWKGLCYGNEEPVFCHKETVARVFIPFRSRRVIESDVRPSRPELICSPLLWRIALGCERC